MRRILMKSKLASVITFALAIVVLAATAFAQTDPGVRGGAAGAGGALASVTANAQQNAFFQAGLGQFAEQQVVQGGDNNGLGPRFNLDGCGGCHSQPAIGGTAPATNPEVAIATANGGRNTVPSFI